MSQAEEAAARRAAELLAEKPDEATEESSGTEEAVAETPQETVEDELNPELPDDIKSLLEDPEEEDEPEDEPDETYAEQEDYSEESEKLRRQLAKERKRADHLEKMRLREARPKWKREVEKFFPLADAEQVVNDSKSRRSALATAKGQHDSRRPLFEKYLAKERAKLDAEREEMRKDAEKAWGKPTVDTPPAPAQEQSERLERARRRGDLSDRIKARFLTPS